MLFEKTGIRLATQRKASNFLLYRHATFVSPEAVAKLRAQTLQAVNLRQCSVSIVEGLGWVGADSSLD